MMTARMTASRVGLVGLVVCLASCGDSNPTAPSGTPTTTASLTAASAGQALEGLGVDSLDVEAEVLPLVSAPDGSTLKATAPTPLSPINDLETETLTPTLTVGNAQPTFVPSADFTYLYTVYEVQDDGSLVLVDTREVDQTANTTSYRLSEDLEQRTSYQWRAVAKIGDKLGPLSSMATFSTPTLLDPPTPVSPANGSTVNTRRPELIVTNVPLPPNVGAVVYEFHLGDEGPSFPNPAVFSVNPSTGTTTTGMFQDALALDTPFWWRVRSTDGVIASDWSSTYMFQTPVFISGPRTPDPPPGQLLPVPDMFHLVVQLAGEIPAALANSCQEDGGTWEFMDTLVDRLRLTDTRWGYNCKRGNCNDPSLDVVAYHRGAGPTVEGVGDTRTVDVIGGHCGPDPSPQWGLQGEFGPDVVRWTSRGRF